MENEEVKLTEISHPTTTEMPETTLTTATTDEKPTMTTEEKSEDQKRHEAMVAQQKEYRKYIDTIKQRLPTLRIEEEFNRLRLSLLTSQLEYDSMMKQLNTPQSKEEQK
jgi:hypothetical protein